MDLLANLEQPKADVDLARGLACRPKEEGDGHQPRKRSRDAAGLDELPGTIHGASSPDIRWTRCPCRVDIPLGLPFGEHQIGCTWEGVRYELGTHPCMFSDMSQFLRLRQSLVAVLDMFGIQNYRTEVGSQAPVTPPSTPPRTAKRAAISSPSSSVDLEELATNLPDMDTLNLH